MSQSQIVPVKLADNEKNRKNEDTHKKSPQKLCKRPITRCIASLQSSSYTVFKQKIGEDFL
ncbi:hypothetical protein [Enterococcus cecorum]|uniref:hypothetical protein n=1 Tax=Enterococcus cecorum TaxID=44008 RepID=UPI0032650F9A